MVRGAKILCPVTLAVLAGVTLAMARAAEDSKYQVTIPEPPAEETQSEQPPPLPKTPDAQKDNQPPPVKAPDAPQEEKKTPIVVGGELQDPTIPSSKLKQVLNQGKGSGPGSLPAVVLKGRIISKDGPPAAILELNGKTFIVGKGNVLPGGGNIILRVEDINTVEVRIEVLPHNEIISLR
jgi:hypothetical protein